MAAPARNATTTSDIVVELSGVFKTFYQRQRSEKLSDVFRNLIRPQIREVRALRNISLRIRQGEIVAYAGPNGAGKSTTVKLLSSVLAPDAGTVRVLGLDPWRDRRHYVNRIGVVFGQRTELWWDHPVASSFEWKRVVWDIPDPKYQRMLGLIKELLGLDEFFNSMARELSLGQKMRADLGLALIHEPEILFLDEPTIELDVLAKRHILQFIKDLNKREEVTIMVTSHDMSDLEELAGRIVMIDKGQIAYDGDFDRLRSEFADRRRLVIEASTPIPPKLTGAEFIQSLGIRHEYLFEASHVKIVALLDEASAQTQILDVETHRAPIDEVIADIYEKWQKDKITHA
jgi:ABC-2 type transport system ATP-binding protein